MYQIKLLDGGFYKRLSEITGEVLEDHPLWGSRFLKFNEEACIQAHRDTIRNGADIIKTVTYQGSVNGFQKYLKLTEEQSINLIKRSVDLARKAIELEIPNRAEGIHERKIQVCGSVGSYGAWLNDGSEYRGEYLDTISAEVLREWHRPRVQALVQAGVEILSFDTIPGLKEAEVLLNLIKEFPTVKATVSFSCKDDQHISHGEKFSSAAIQCWDINSGQILAVGVNCLHPKLVVPLLKPVRDRAPHIPLMCYPNTEETFDLQLKKWVGKEQCQPLVNYLQSFLDLRIEYIGGCCQSTLQDLRDFRQYIEQQKLRSV